MVITAKLNSASLKQAANKVRDYGNELQVKIYNVLRILAEKGITVAEQTIGNFGKYITFSRVSETDGMVIVAQETSVILAEWMMKNGETKKYTSYNCSFPYLFIELLNNPNLVYFYEYLFQKLRISS